MATDTAEPTSLQTGTTPNPVSSNAQDFSGSDDEIMDNFAEGPQPGDPPRRDTHDDGVPMGLGGEKGKQSEPVSSTLEADIANGTTKQAGEKLPPADSAGEPEPVEEPAGEAGAETSPEPSEQPETPEFPPTLLQMAGLADAKAAKAAGFDSPDALFAAIRWRGQLLTPGAQAATAPEQGLYRRSPQPAPTAPTVQQPVVEPEASGDFKAFQLPPDKRDMLDEDLLDVLDQMNEHYQNEMKSLRSTIVQQETVDDEAQFDKVVQSLGDEWQDVFGEGDGRDLARSGQNDPVAMTNFNHRALLFEAVEAVREVNSKQGYKPMALEQEVQWALMQRYPDKFQQILTGNSNGKSGPRPGVTASRPTQRNTPPKSQNAKVLSDVNAMLQKRRGYALDMGTEEEFEGDI